MAFKKKLNIVAWEMAGPFEQGAEVPADHPQLARWLKMGAVVKAEAPDDPDPALTLGQAKEAVVGPTAPQVTTGQPGGAPVSGVTPPQPEK